MSDTWNSTIPAEGSELSSKGSDPLSASSRFVKPSRSGSCAASVPSRGSSPALSSKISGMSSSSSSGSELSPMPSPSVSMVSPGSSGKSSALSPRPSPSVSYCSLLSSGKASSAFLTPSLSRSRSITSTSESPSVLSNKSTSELSNARAMFHD